MNNMDFKEKFFLKFLGKASTPGYAHGLFHRSNRTLGLICKRHSTPHDVHNNVLNAKREHSLPACGFRCGQKPFAVFFSSRTECLDYETVYRKREKSRFIIPHSSTSGKDRRTG